MSDALTKIEGEMIEQERSKSGIKKLAQKMIKVMSQVDYIRKSGVNQFHKYKYATESDVSGVFSKALADNDIFMFSSIVDRECKTYQTRGGKEAFLVTVKIEITFVDAESGESFTSTFYGDGTDSDDKAVYKAITGAQKYALMKTFLVETGDDPEREDAVTTMKSKIKISEKQIKSINVILKAKNFDDERIKKALDYYEVDDIKDMNSEQANQFIEQLKRA